MVSRVHKVNLAGAELSCFFFDAFEHWKVLVVISFNDGLENILAVCFFALEDEVLTSKDQVIHGGVFESSHSEDRVEEQLKVGSHFLLAHRLQDDAQVLEQMFSESAGVLEGVDVAQIAQVFKVAYHQRMQLFYIGALS